MKQHQKVVLSSDIGGTFTDVVIEVGHKRSSIKVLTTHAAPEAGVMDGVARVLALSGVEPGQVDLFVHGTTLATNAILERKGARTALITTEGFRDSVEIGYENRFDQYDIFIEKPRPLVPRDLRFTVPERLAVNGEVLLPLDTDALVQTCSQLKRCGIESVAIGFLHSYANPAHEREARRVVEAHLPDVNITISSDVCPEAREYERFSTACANAYVQPAIGAYLTRLRTELERQGFSCPLLLMSSGGGLMTVETAIAFPIRLVESGPAGGAILSAHIARLSGIDRILSFDMGGTTAKVCLIDEGRPRLSRDFEVDRQYRFLRGSGLPLRIPVIDMVEIGAGGGSIAAVDKLGRITVGPQSAGSEPGPVSYGRGGERPTVTDANLLLGRLDPQAFAGGAFTLDVKGARQAIERDVGRPLGTDAVFASYGVSEIVEENMANAARVHAIDRGVDLSDRTLIAFGGAAPIHAAGLAEKLGIRRVIIPRSAGVGSAVGFLRAPIAFQVVRSGIMRLSSFDPRRFEALFAEMSSEASNVVGQGAPGQAIEEQRSLDMRYCGQGHEIVVPLLASGAGAIDASAIRRLFEEHYEVQFGRVIPGMDVEITGYGLVASAAANGGETQGEIRKSSQAAEPISPISSRDIFDATIGRFCSTPVYARSALVVGSHFEGPAIIVEDETTTVVSPSFSVTIDEFGSIILGAKE